MSSQRFVDIVSGSADLAVFVYETTPAFFSDPFFRRHIDAYQREVTQLSDPARSQLLEEG